MPFDIDIPTPPVSRARTYLEYSRSYERRVIAAVLLLGMCVGIWLILPPTAFPRNSVITIPPDSSAHAFATELSQEHVIRSAFVFRVLARVTGLDRHLDTGAYAFTKPESVLSVLWRISEAKHGIAPVRVTLTEGMTRFDMADTFKETLPGFDEKTFLQDASTSEGYLFPETYFFMPDDASNDIVARMRSQFASSTEENKAVLTASKHSLTDIVIMASILEREAKSPQDMRIVAGILWNRIENGMPLQVDAAFGYAHQANGYTPTATDLNSDSPYNTYKNRGLPPTAISNPGINALLAAAQPAKTSYVYYLTGSDGLMHYATTFTQHKKNKTLYLK